SASPANALGGERLNDPTPAHHVASQLFRLPFWPLPQRCLLPRKKKKGGNSWQRSGIWLRPRLNNRSRELEHPCGGKPPTLAHSSRITEATHGHFFHRCRRECQHLLPTRLPTR